MPATVPLPWFVVAVVVAVVSLAIGIWKVVEDRRLRGRTAQDWRRAQALLEEAEQRLAGAAAEAQRRGNIAAQEQWQAALNKSAAERDRAIEALAAEREVFRLREEALVKALEGATTERAQTGQTARPDPVAAPDGAG